MNTKYYIYALQEKKGQRPFYIGCTTDIKRRLKEHNCRFMKTRDIKPILKVLKTAKTYEQACIEEAKYIFLYKKLVGSVLINKGFKKGKRLKCN